MKKTHLTQPIVTAASWAAFLLAAVSVRAATNTLTFDGVGSLAAYEGLGVTFSQNASFWDGSAYPSILENPNGGARSLPSALQFGNAGGALGSIYFDTDVGMVSIWVLSGPTPDLLSSTNIYVKAFDASGEQIGQDSADATQQFDLLTILAPGIRRLDLFSPSIGNEAWDDLTFDMAPRPVLSIEVSQVRICWNSETNRLNQIQYRSELTTNTWVNLGTPILGDGGTDCITDEVAGPRRFYRAVVLP